MLAFRPAAAERVQNPHRCDSSAESSQRVHEHRQRDLILLYSTINRTTADL